ncbi:hypothetical protein B0T14DRAFT_70589 [Immersiella caudata]|uniref:Uncharacterized protein n=1 Tax=Immersiella caudata TaxID=314043 RepID=A0AA40CCL5_9PEZI|nr:hypothetical protein B0T14DRAFT_70589 [Immersiella caudata]
MELVELLAKTGQHDRHHHHHHSLTYKLASAAALQVTSMPTSLDPASTSATCCRRPPRTAWLSASAPAYLRLPGQWLRCGMWDVGCGMLGCVLGAVVGERSLPAVPTPCHGFEHHFDGTDILYICRASPNTVHTHTLVKASVARVGCLSPAVPSSSPRLEPAGSSLAYRHRELLTPCYFPPAISCQPPFHHGGPSRLMSS